MAELGAGEPDLKEMEEEDLWDLINNHRHRVSLDVRPCMLIPYLRQARVLNELDEDEILNCMKFPNRSMRTSHMLDILRTQGRNGAMALLESVMIHYPELYTHITGRRPSTEPSHFSGLIKDSELTEYLVRAATSMQQELQRAQREAAAAGARGAALQAQLSRAERQGEELRQLRAEHVRLRSHVAGLHRDVLRLKDEKCDLHVRYTAAVEENSAVNIRCRDLQLQMYQLQFELRKAQTETDFQRERSVKCSSPSETQQLREEVCTLRRQLLQAEKFTPAREDILAQDLEEARDGRTELLEQICCLREESEKLARERGQLLEEKESLELQVKKLSLDCEMYQQKSTVIQSQLRELQAERDQAYLLRDEAQAQIASSLAEKDTLRAHVVELQEKLFSLRAVGTETQTTTPERLRERIHSWDSGSDCSPSSPRPPRPRPRLRRLEAVCLPYPRDTDSSTECSEEGFSSFRSHCAEPPGLESLRRRQEELQLRADSPDMTDWEITSIAGLESDYMPYSHDICKGHDEVIAPPRPVSLPSNDSSSGDGPTAPPFLVRLRPKALRITGRIMTISFQGEALLSQLEVIGGNKTGVFVHKVTEESPAQSVGISPGAQILEVRCEQDRRSTRMVLEDSTLEEALWALGQVRGFCHLSLRPKQDGYEKLLLQLRSGEVTSGDSFYVRVNMSVPGGSTGALAVTCNDVLHVTNTRHCTNGFWKASHVHPCKLQDLKSGTLPNYYRAQRLLIRAIEDMAFQHRPERKIERCQAQEKQKAVRIVSTGRLGPNPLWVSVEEDDTKENKESGDSAVPRSCVTLMPYTLVTPRHPPTSRPVLLFPTMLGRIIDKKLGCLPGFQLCEPEVLGAGEHTLLTQRAEVLEDCEPGSRQCYTLRGVERVIKQGSHCILPLGLDCVRRLQKAEIYPIIIYIVLTDRSIRRLRQKLQRQGCSEEQLLDCSRSEEPLLDKLPCLYRRVLSDSWNDSATLLRVLQTTVLEEQSKIVWLEADLW
ncbi:caspase recruitment domain-containing protein 14 [Anguilla anguilla]|uniref:caspase recruitment domain-containing protein 14 n=1 Tax=Anguilla anguilla TaxID=7936 RepID=UPI0015A965F9|nr:caspase recruitment domain-containing protein 14 [Anguilla anguilla]